MVDITISVANADLGPVAARLGKFKKELATEMVDLKTSGDPTATYVLVDRIIQSLQKHRKFLDGS